MRNVVRRLLALVIGLPLALGGIVVIAWTLITVTQMPGAFEIALFVAQNWPIPLGAPPEGFAQLAMVPERALFAGFLGLVGYLIGAGMLRNTFGRGSPPDVSDDGLARLELATAEPRVGHPIEGRLRVLKKSQPNEMFSLVLRCRRTYRPPVSDDDRVETAFYEECKVGVLQDASGLAIPFRFALPITAPASGVGPDGFHWRLEVARTKAWISSFSGFTLQVAPADPGQLRAMESAQPPALQGEVDDLERRLVALGKPPLSPHQRAEVRAMSPEKRAEARRMLEGVDKLASWVQKAFTFVFVAIAGIVLLGFSAAWLLTR